VKGKIMNKKKNGNEWVSSLSKNIFWDTRTEMIDIKKDKNFIIERIAVYGEDNDVDKMFNMYRKREIKSVLKKAEWLNEWTIAYFGLILNIKKEKFKCYGKKQPHLI